ncbi:GGH hydrolase, partial [Polypterus senegalus]
MVVAEVSRTEEERYKIKAVSQGRQEGWTTWEGVVSRNISWSDLWRIPQARVSFLIRATYDTLPCPRNLNQWFGNEESCALCNAPNASLQHILSGCKIALYQGRYRWRHDQVLRKLAEVLEGRRQGSTGPPLSEDCTSFVTEGGGQSILAQETSVPSHQALGKSYIAASYVKFLESAGARVVPIRSTNSVLQRRPANLQLGDPELDMPDQLESPADVALIDDFLHSSSEKSSKMTPFIG